MKIFAIDTCCMAATSAIVEDDRLIAQTVINHKKTHSQKMMPQIESMFKLSEIDIKDIDIFSAAVGPGSFTGVRIGVATVKAMAQALDKPCVGVSTLMALANQVNHFGGIICPILDARREQVYNALFRRGEEIPIRLCEDRAVPIEELFEELEKSDDEIMFLGDGYFVYKDIIIERLGKRAVFPQSFLNMNLAGSVASAAEYEYSRGNFVKYSELAPSYVRLSQAERDAVKKGIL